MLEKNKRTQNYYSVGRIIKEVKDNARLYDKDNPTAKEVLEYMIGDQDGWTSGEFVVYRYDDRNKRTFLQRLNTLWVYPLFILTIPLQYLFTGSWGVNRNTKFGKLIFRLVGYND